MSRIAYVNGQYVPHARAAVHIEDRGYQFADAIYEVCEIKEGYIIDMGPHLDRLDRSLHELRITAPMARMPLIRILREVANLNRVRNGLVYIQISRGVAAREHYFPSKPVRASIVVTAKRIDPRTLEAKADNGIKVISVPENRWERVDIKTVGLLPNVLAKQAAREAGATEAWFVDNSGMVTEGGSTNAWILTKDNRLVTRQADCGILRGITREGVLQVAQKRQIIVEERSFSIREAQEAVEAFVTSASALVMPVVEIDKVLIGDGRPGHLSRELRKEFHERAERTKL
ncbi:D-amino-acid transaminase [Polycladidibacter hongkongensis]|uniref:D-amino-acid transaminase n=1 Tax=Polycladidibacter hongkongensis TaxID=1647556 RepID=UPI000837458C|nr:D-amino-acid transaminase [Pseudovibrio hongkongensis]